MRSFAPALLGLLALPAIASASIASKGGWSLSATYASCPANAQTCFSDQTGLTEDEYRNNECCPEGTTPELYCGTYVNTGQPYACCPIDNPDCRGDIEKTNSTQKCANTGWAMWYVPEFGDNHFCCLPDQYGYFFPRFGQNAVGQCTNSSILPNGAQPGIQVNNGDGTVAPNGTQLTTLPSAAPTVAPTCDLTYYGWSLQTNDSSCTPGSDICSNGASCCPTTLQCGSVQGDGEVPVCCPADNPDCRGDVEGLYPQLCSDSSWSLWHVNTNGNHFCCKPGQVGYNLVGNVSALGFCGDAVPASTNVTRWMRSILDYEGDGSTPGSFAEFPCDSQPEPTYGFSSMVWSILNPPTALNNPSYYNSAGWPTSVPAYSTGTAALSTMAATPAPTSGGSGGSGSGGSGSGGSGSGGSGSGGSGSGGSGGGSGDCVCSPTATVTVTVYANGPSPTPDTPNHAVNGSAIATGSSTAPASTFTGGASLKESSAAMGVVALIFAFFL